jgi:hypothetical protein
MRQAFRDLLREERNRGAIGLIALWMHTLPDLASTAFRERSDAMRKGFGGLLVLGALLLGLLIALVDNSPGWDDTGISAAALLGGAMIFGVARPAHAWRWALAVGLWIPLLGIIRTHNYTILLALIFPFVGAYIGAFARRLFTRTGGTA